MSNCHIHVYFAEPDIELAREVRANLVSLLPQLTYQGQLINQPVGPHPVPMFELICPKRNWHQPFPSLRQTDKDCPC